MSSLDKGKIREFLMLVNDPEFEIDIVNLGLVYDIQVQDSKVKIVMTLTSMGCPAAPLIETKVKNVVRLIEGVKDVEVEWTFDPPWDLSKMTKEGRDFMEYSGYL
jgi:metal-sulfur cluster biosynthetic enzyme